MVDPRRNLETLGYIRLLTLLMTCAGAPGCSETRAPQHQTVELAGQTFQLELALTDEQIRRGMMGRDKIADDRGMLFVFPRAEHRSFWMKNCLVDLDVLFLDREGRIVAIHEMKVLEPHEANDPPGYPSRWPAQFAIELRGGRTGELGLEVGHKVDLPFGVLVKQVE